MSIRVESETGALRRVLVHRPGLEIDRMIPEMMAELLFDDILFGKQARREHHGFCEVLRLAGAETLDPQDLLAEVLEEQTLRETVIELYATLCDVLAEEWMRKYTSYDFTTLSGHREFERDIRKWSPPRYGAYTKHAANDYLHDSASVHRTHPRLGGVWASGGGKYIDMESFPLHIQSTVMCQFLFWHIYINCQIIAINCTSKNVTIWYSKSQ